MLFVLWQDLHSGIIISKKHEEARITDGTSFFIFPSGLIFPFSGESEKPERWLITVKGQGWQEDAHKDIEVSKAAFDSLSIGKEMSRQEDGVWR